MSSLKSAVSRVKRQFTSRNSVPVERAFVRSEDIDVILAAIPESKASESPWVTGDVPVGSKAFLEELEGHHNEICLYGGTHMTRLIGYYEDDDDCYYVVAGRYGDKTIRLSCVGGLLSLKHYLPEEVYQGIESTFALNGSEATETFSIQKAVNDE